MTEESEICLVLATVISVARYGWGDKIRFVLTTVISREIGIYLALATLITVGI